MYNFSGRIVAVTGAAKGLGATVAKRFLEENADKVALLDLNETMLNETIKEIDPSGQRTLGLACDVSDAGAVEKAFEKIFEKFGRVDILINNAGITRDSMAKKMTMEAFDSVVKISLNGAFYCTRQVIEGMRERGWGRIISLSSLAAFGNIGQSNYSAAKAGLIGMTRTLALELGPQNITVNCIAPGIVNTDIIQTIPEKQLADMLSKIPLRRAGEPEEVASLAVFLASGEAAYISGQCIKLTGGLN